MFTRRQPFKIRKKTTFSRQIELSYRSLMMIVIVLNVILSVILLGLGAIGSSQGYTLKKLQRENLDLSNQSKELDLKLTNVKSLESVMRNNTTREMTPTEIVTFINNAPITVKKNSTDSNNIN